MPDVKISVIFAATEVHIRNVSRTPVLDLRRGSNDPNRLGVGVVHETGTRRGHWNVGIVSRDREAVYWHVSRVARAMVRDGSRRFTSTPSYVILPSACCAISKWTGWPRGHVGGDTGEGVWRRQGTIGVAQRRIADSVRSHSRPGIAHC
jgi:hypothetical protein